MGLPPTIVIYGNICIITRILTWKWRHRRPVLNCVKFHQTIIMFLIAFDGCVTIGKLWMSLNPCSISYFCSSQTNKQITHYDTTWMKKKKNHVLNKKKIKNSIKTYRPTHIHISHANRQRDQICRYKDNNLIF